MAGQGASRLKDFARVASGVAQVFNEALSNSPAIAKLKAGDFVGSTTVTLKFLQNSVADVTGLTQGRLHSHPNATRSDATSRSSSSSQSDSGISSGSGFSPTEPLKPRTTTVTGSQREELFRPASSFVDDEHSARRPEEIIAEAGSPMQGELYGVNCSSGKDHLSPGGTGLGGIQLSPARESSSPESGQVLEEAPIVFQESSEEKNRSPSLEEAGGIYGGLSGIKSGTTEHRPVKKRKPRERRVPSTPLGRIMGFAGLGAGLAWGSVQESARRLWEGQGSPGQSILSPFVTEQNAERIALALCRMRGAALKVGQMLSIQDESLVPMPILAALERVRQGADVMPGKQLVKVLDRELGSGWRERLTGFDDEPIASASIGQVHRAVLKDGREVAMKVQYPGVAASIDSDIDNVRLLLEYTNLLPKGLYLDEAMRVAKEELERECNYEYEAMSQKRFRKLLEGEQGLHVPLVIDEFSTRSVLTSELVPGVSIDKVAKMDQKIRNEVGSRLLNLTLRELFVFHFMQTDPNWGNFLYDESTNTINLIDFGAARDFPKKFVDDYLEMVFACANRDRKKIIEMSIRLGFLTGEEEMVMLDAHTEAAYVTGEPFSKWGGYDFRGSDMPRRVSELGATMLKHRLRGPPDEAYSLHRKLSGAFLACVKLGAVVPCREILDDMYKNYSRSSETGEEAQTSKVASA